MIKEHKRIFQLGTGLALLALLGITIGAGTSTAAVEENYREAVLRALPPTVEDLHELGQGWYEVTLSGPVVSQCFLFNTDTKRLTKRYDGACGDPAPSHVAEVTINSDDVLNAISGKKLKFITRKQTEPANEAVTD